MKELFFDFQLSKDKMNKINGGGIWVCNCKSKPNELFVITGQTIQELNNEGQVYCKGDKAQCFAAP